MAHLYVVLHDPMAEDQEATVSSHPIAGKPFTLPPEWSDEERMHYLLAPLPPHRTAPSHSDPKIKFWSSLILGSSRELKKPFFTAEELVGRLNWKGISPSCLPAVMEVMERKGDVMKMPEYEAASQNAGWVAWGVGMVVKPVSWVWRSYFPKKNYQGTYIITAIVKVR